MLKICRHIPDHISRLLLWVGLVAVCLAIADGAAYFIRRWTNSRQVAANKMEYLINKADEDIIILGNSVAEFHLDSEIIADSCGMTCFNAAKPGTQFKFNLAELRLMMARYSPKVVILAFNTHNFFGRYPEVSFSQLRMLYNIHSQLADSIIQDVFPHQRYLMASDLLNLNSYGLAWITSKFLYKESTIKSLGGFRPLNYSDTHPSGSVRKPDQGIPDFARDRLRLLSNLCKNHNTRLIIVTPPTYYLPEKPNKFASEMQELADNCGFVFWDDIYHPAFNRDSTLFYDFVHLNERGAEIYSDSVALRLRQLIKPLPGSQ